VEVPRNKIGVVPEDVAYEDKAPQRAIFLERRKIFA
jgi:hypothetical protein